MDKFKVIINDERTQVEADGAIEDIAINVGVTVNAIYSAYLNSDPSVAEYFNNLVQRIIIDDSFPTWKPKMPHEDDLTIIHNPYGGG